MELTHPKDMVKETSGWRTRLLAASVPIHSVQQQLLSCGGELRCTQEEPEAFPEQPSAYPQGRGLVPGPEGGSQNVQSSSLLMALQPPEDPAPSSMQEIELEQQSSLLIQHL